MQKVVGEPAPNESTRDRIRAVALELFNAEGYDRVPIFRIAAALGISPGNLNYHFARKSDLLYDLVEQLKRELGNVFATERAATPSAMAEYSLSVFSIMWNFRFFFGSVLYLIGTDEYIAAAYEHIANRAVSRTDAQMKWAIKAGEMRPVKLPNTTTILAENMWASWLYKLNFHTLSKPVHSSQRAEALYQMCMHHVSLIQPYSGSAFISSLVQETTSRISK